jgi:hypothetical protein
MTRKLLNIEQDNDSKYCTLNKLMIVKYLALNKVVIVKNLALNKVVIVKYLALNKITIMMCWREAIS